ncbi:unnamed protein product [Microthlaspi erraticum]|uniref:Uncharacterized protein n=1 Tax=Microthlaspi erraticum TaxID=1685480 RepID=A0A6D2I3T3_9BRAS|nr:unnamed protein product [Microthlaspi erraticum]
MFRARPNRIRPSEVSAKVQTTRPITHHDPGNIARGRPSHNAHATPRTTKRASREQASRPRNLSRTTADASVRAGKNVPRPAENFIGQIFIRSDHAGRPRIRPTPTVPTRPRPDCPADRPDRPSQRRGRPEALLKPKIMFSSPA